ncbi:MAG: hypothetical protein F4138_00535 [Acidimicrobiia bacterium]|nr:hypothetical protein [Acidimicrobiia bacterium]MYC58299.1 hypothetical protein [Acidimicrobiia bacterium]MYG93474.1 hypothetical protein [Acidimicrobiia bacterium]MYI29994.1 hypothetical protein [Acidimicrobiia bacterium]
MSSAGPTFATTASLVAGSTIQSSFGHRDEKALNAAIAAAISRCHPRAVVEAERASRLVGSAKQPDITVDAPGRERVLIENKYAGVFPRALEQQCLAHFGTQWATDQRAVRVVVGMRSPERLDDFSDEDLAEGVFTEITFQWAMWSVNGEGDPVRFPESGWLKGRIAELAAFIDRAGVDGADIGPVAELLQVRLTAAVGQATEGVGTTEAFGEVLNQEPGEQTNRMAMAILFNAMLFQFHIANHHPKIPTPSQMMADSKLDQLHVLKMWQDILEVNYWPIFGVSRRLLRVINSFVGAKRALEILCLTVGEVVEEPNSSGLVGRFFGELIGDRKFLATFYTRPASAALLAELAVDRLDVDWSNPEAIAGLRVGDMACGTGALLTAVYRRIVERHRVEGGDDAKVHRPLMEEVMIGCDIMAAAVHLTVARLSGERPDIDYTSTKTWVMPYGKVADTQGVVGYRIGALDLLHSNKRYVLWGDGTMAAAAQGEDALAIADVPAESLDIAIMNPPFTRPTNHEAGHAEVPNPAFAGLGNDLKDQKAMSDALAMSTGEIRGDKASHGNAGIASNFIDLAHIKLKPGGVLALILPASLVSGAAWGGARGLLALRYENIIVVSISGHGDESSEGRAFSADTGMAEVIVLATKKAGSATGVSKIVHAILNNRPSSSVAGVEMAREINAKTGDSGLLMVGCQDIGLHAVAPLGPEMKGQPVGVSNVDVMVVSTELIAGRLHLPRHAPVVLPISTLNKLGYRGPVHRDISGRNTDETSRGPFDIVKLKDRSRYAEASWPVLWSHDHTFETTMQVLPCSQGIERSEMKGLGLIVWNGRINELGYSIAGATRLHLNSDFRLNSQPMAACLTPKPVIGGVAWPSFQPTADDEVENENWEKAICVWLNSTLGLVGRWWVSNRQQTGRARLTVSTLGSISVLNLRAISVDQRQALAEVFDQFEHRPMLPANEAYRDNVRQELDKRVLCDVLDLPTTILDPLSTLRFQWCAEPSVHGGKKTRP